MVLEYAHKVGNRQRQCGGSDDRPAAACGLAPRSENPATQNGPDVID